jgi:hypothetical protein
MSAAGRSSGVPASEALLAILSPLPSLRELAQQSAAPHPRDPSPPSKRPRTLPASPTAQAAPETRPGGIPRDVAAAADAVRRAGAPADTLFFAGVPSRIDDEHVLRDLIRLPLRDLKLLRPSRGNGAGKSLAWASFFNEADCITAFVALRRNAPSLRPRFHTPRAGGGTAGPGAPATEKVAAASTAGGTSLDNFQTRADKIVAEGGLANTVLLRGLPLDVTVEEMTAVLACFGAGTQPLRSRTSEVKSGNARNFWMTYASRDAACAAFVAMAGQHASFRCGKTQRLTPVVHNDATDAESKVRRAREAALGVHATAGDVSRCHAGPETAPGDYALHHVESAGGDSKSQSNLERLDGYMRSQPGRLYFLRERPAR